MQTEITIPLDRIIIDPEANFSRFAPNEAKIKSLTESIRNRGLINPITVRRNIGDDTYILVAGFQRIQALEALGMDARATVLDIDPESNDSLAVNTAENTQRSNLTLMDYAMLIDRSKKSGKKAGDIAKEIGQSQAWVSQVGKLANLREEIKYRIHKGEIPFTLARDLPGMTDEEQDSALAKMSQGSVTEQAKERAKKKTKKDARGRKSKGPSLSDAVEAFTELSADPTEDAPKETKSQVRTRQVFSLFGAFLSGKFGAKALENKLAELL